ncbi:MAG: hypothetical protein R6U89_12135 [Dehalococcoidia bacterium]
MITRETRSWKDINEGDELPVFQRNISRIEVVAMAFAARDFHAVSAVHADHEIAQAAGLKDVNVNIISAGGLIEKYLTDWSGPKAVLKRLKYNIGLSAYPGDTLVHTGRVTGKYTEDGQHLVDIEYAVAVADGPFTWGNATLAFPAP